MLFRHFCAKSENPVPLYGQKLKSKFEQNIRKTQFFSQNSVLQKFQWRGKCKNNQVNRRPLVGALAYKRGDAHEGCYWLQPFIKKPLSWQVEIVFVNGAFYGFAYEATPLIFNQNNATCKFSASYVDRGAVTAFFNDSVTTITTTKSDPISKSLLQSLRTFHRITSAKFG